MSPARAPARPTLPPPPVVDGVAVPHAFEDLPPELQRVTLRLAKAIYAAIPGAQARTKWATPFYYGRGPVCYLTANVSQRKVALGILQGHRLHDPQRLLVGTGKSPIRKLELRRGASVPRALGALLRQAAQIDRDEPLPWD